MKEITLWIAPGVDGAEARTKLREEIEKALTEPSYSIITNHPLYWATVSQGSTIVAEDARAEQITLLREELEKAWADPKYIPLVSVEVSVGRKPAVPE